MNTLRLGKQKYSILLLLFLGWSLGNLDRFSINYTVLGISTDFGLHASETGFLLSSFFIGYTLMQIPGGYLADRFGYRKVILISLLSWSIFTFLTGAAWSLVSMIVIRILFGFGEGGFFPAGSKAIANWFPHNQRSRAMSLMLISASVLGVITPLLSIALMKSVGWRALFFLFGGCGILVVILMFLFLQEKREEMPEISEKQGAIVQQKASLKTVLKTPLIWNLFIAYFSVYVISWGMNSWMPTYLHQARGLDLTTVGYVSAIPAFVSIFAMFLSGYLLDKLPDGTDRKVAVVCALVMGVLLYLMSTASTIPLFVLYSCLLNVFSPFVITLIATAALKMLPVEQVGSANGFINTGAQAAGILAPIVIGFLVEAFGGSYTPAFIMLVAFAVLCAIALLLARTKKTGVAEAQPALLVALETIGSEI